MQLNIMPHKTRMVELLLLGMMITVCVILTLALLGIMTEYAGPVNWAVAAAGFGLMWFSTSLVVGLFIKK